MTTNASLIVEKYRTLNSFRKMGVVGNKPREFEYKNEEFPSLDNSNSYVSPTTISDSREMYSNTLIKNSVWNQDASSTSIKPISTSNHMFKKRTTVHPIITPHSTDIEYVRTYSILSCENECDDNYDEDEYYDEEDYHKPYISER